MILLVASSLIGVAAPFAGSSIAVEDLPRIFMEACLEGETRLSPGQVTPVAFQDIPKSLRDRLGRANQGKVWRLNASGRAYLYMLSEQASGARVCGLASDRMPLNPARAALEKRVDTEVTPDQLRTTVWWRPEDGYVAIATTAAKFNVLQIKWLSERERRLVLEELRYTGAGAQRRKPGNRPNK